MGELCENPIFLALLDMTRCWFNHKLFLSTSPPPRCGTKQTTWFHQRRTELFLSQPTSLLLPTRLGGSVLRCELFMNNITDMMDGYEVLRFVSINFTTTIYIIVTTNVIITPNQTLGECPEVWILHDQHHKYHGYHLHHQCCYKSYQSSHFVMSRGVHQTFSNIIISETHSSSFLDYIVNKYTLNKIYFSPVCRHGFSLS